MEIQHYYEVETEWNTGRQGVIKSEILNDAIEVATPPEFPGGIPGIWSPEHLFVASANVCLMTTFLAIAENSKLEFVSYKCKAVGKLEKADGKFMISEIEYYPEIILVKESDTEKANRIINKAESNCLISNSMKSKMTLVPNILIKKD